MATHQGVIKESYETEQKKACRTRLIVDMI